MITHSSLADDLLPISLATLPLTSTVGVNVYLKTRPSEPPLLFSAAHNPISRQHFEELMRIGSSKLFIRRKDRDLYQQAVRDCWDTLLLDRSLPVLQRLAAVHDLTRESLIEQFESRHFDSLIKTCQHYGAASVAVLGDDPVTVAEVREGLHHDRSLATHATNVAAYSALLGRRLGFAATDLAQLVTGALLHDLGMLDIEGVVLNKPGRLFDCERRLVQGHPALGLQRVIERNDLVEGTMMMIYQHHERMNGSGYPVGVAGEEIHTWSRVCAIADVFSALTCGRPQRQSVNPQTAAAVLDRGAGSDFDREIVSCWRRIA